MKLIIDQKFKIMHNFKKVTPFGSRPNFLGNEMRITFYSSIVFRSKHIIKLQI